MPRQPVNWHDQRKYVAGPLSLKSTGRSSSLGGGCVPITPLDATISSCFMYFTNVFTSSSSILTPPHPSSQSRRSLLFSSDFFSQVTSQSHSTIILTREAPLTSCSNRCRTNRGKSRVWQSYRDQRVATSFWNQIAKWTFSFHLFWWVYIYVTTGERKYKDRLSPIRRRRLLFYNKKAIIWLLG